MSRHEFPIRFIAEKVLGLIKNTDEEYVAKLLEDKKMLIIEIAKKKIPSAENESG